MRGRGHLRRFWLAGATVFAASIVVRLTRSPLAYAAFVVTGTWAVGFAFMFLVANLAADSGRAEPPRPIECVRCEAGVSPNRCVACGQERE